MAIRFPVVVKDVTKRYRLGEQVVDALTGVSLTVEPGAFVAVAGPSGSGKTTLLNLIGCLDTPTEGEIEIEGKPVSRLRPVQRADLRARRLGFVFQTFNLIPVLSAWENVEYPLLLRPGAGDVRARVEATLARVGLADRARHRPAQLSGGQQQRVAIARALVGDPALVLADEPTANLDGRTGREVIDLMRELNRERGTTFVFSTHDPRILAAADRVVHLVDGRLHPEGG